MALVLPPGASGRVQAVIDDVSSRFGTGVSTAPPHITLVPPFRMSNNDLPALETALAAFAGGRAATAARLTGFSCFEPRVAYVDVDHEDVADVWAGLNAALVQECPFVQLEGRPFKPHVTVASKRVTPEKFAGVWGYLRGRPFADAWLVEEVTLLRFDGAARRWQTHSTHPFKA